MGLDLAQHDIRFEEDNWESPTLGAWGIGWQVMLDGMEITQFTYFQQAGGLDLAPISAEITYGLERIAMFLGLSKSIYDIEWVPGGPSYGQVRHQEEVEFSRYYFEIADVAFLQAQFDGWEREARRCLEAGVVLPAYECALKCSQLFNVLDARGAVSVTERVGLMKRVRDLAVSCAAEYLASRERLGFPLLARPSGGDGEADGAAEGGGAWLGRRGSSRAATSCSRCAARRSPRACCSPPCASWRRARWRSWSAAAWPPTPSRPASRPRRLVLTVRGLPEREPVSEELVTGPPVAVAFDAEGNPTPGGSRLRPALRRRARGAGAGGDREGGVPRVCADRSAVAASPRSSASWRRACSSQISWAKSMHWGSGEGPWVRPVHGLLALYRGDVVPMRAVRRRARTTAPSGHPTLSPRELKVRGPGDYRASCRSAASRCASRSAPSVCSPRCGKRAAGAGRHAWSRTTSCSPSWRRSARSRGCSRGASRAICWRCRGRC